MSWNAAGFCRGFESGLLGALMTAGNAGRAAAAQAAHDQDAGRALSRLAGALRLERRRNAELQAEIAALTERLAAKERTLDAIRRHR